MYLLAKESSRTLFHSKDNLQLTLNSYCLSDNHCDHDFQTNTLATSKVDFTNVWVFDRGHTIER